MAKRKSVKISEHDKQHVNQTTTQAPVIQEGIEQEQTEGHSIDQAILGLEQTYGNKYVQRLVESQKETKLRHEISGKIEAQRGTGKPLDTHIQSAMEERFDNDFDKVRIHTDAKANELSQELGAAAFTTGQDIFFKEGAYEPGNCDGTRLIAHELGHVVEGVSEKAIACWKLQGHSDLTDQTMYEPEFIDVFPIPAIELIKSTSKNLDLTFVNIVDSLGMKLKMGRIEREIPNHGEGGAYQYPGEEINMARQEEYLNKAISQANAGDIYGALVTLGNALHVAQDRGAHGEGNPGYGHDPDCYKSVDEGGRGEDWNPDDPSKNTEGWDYAILKSEGVLGNFLFALSAEARQLLQDFTG
ncbi:MAG: DUF4157 domain-containing protein [Chloroflexi bacterium]|nr:DUF4157 domain-containing protein [Chloroflexota bacterium]